MAEPEFDAGPVAVLGLGREGRAAWRYLRTRHPALAIDLVDEAQPAPEFLALLGANDRVVSGPLEQAKLERYAVLLRSPGISPYREPVRQAVRAGARVVAPNSLWFAAHPTARTICITGTKGKSTAAALLFHVLQSSGLRARLAGNIGKALLEYENTAQAPEPDWWVIELSSYQLADLEARPTLGVILNFAPEHLDWHGSLERYRNDKFRLAQLLGGNPLVANAADPELTSRFAHRKNTLWFNGENGFRLVDGRLHDADADLGLAPIVGLPGAHNLSNLAAVLTVARSIGVDVDAALAAAARYRPLPHRLQPLGTRAGIRFVNDSIASTPMATCAALQSLAGESVVLILGGYDRGLDWRPYLKTFLALAPYAVIGLPENGRRVLQELRAAGIRPVGGIHECRDLPAAVAEARRRAPAGGVVLLSPGAPSFPQFRDYRERGRRFAELSGFAFEDWDPF